MNLRITTVVSALLVCFIIGASGGTLLAQKVVYQVHPETGAIRHLAVEGDTRNMNWMLETDGSQYKWIKEDYGWGLGGFSIVSRQDTIQQQWKKANRVEQIADRTNSFYTVGDVDISVSRYYEKDDLIEEYQFSNKGKQAIHLTDMMINTPFNDNYPNAALCNRARTSAHIWEGENAAYVNATHMSGKGPHLGLVLTEGSVKSYEIKERAENKEHSNTRGVIILNPEDITLKPGENYTLSWRIFSHQGHTDFFAKALALGSVIAKSEKYVYETGETAEIVFESLKDLENPSMSVNGKTLPVTKTGNVYKASAPVTQTGDIRCELTYNGGKKTHVSCLGISNIDELMRKRADFIIAHQQLKDVNDKRYGAYMVYDNEENKIFLNDKPSVSYHDRDEGAERMGMGVFLALYYLKTKDEKVKESLLKYASFVRNQLQDKDYNTWSIVDHNKGRNRNYNYPWAAIFYCRMFQVTGNRQFLLDAYGTIQAMYKRFGYTYYATGMAYLLPLFRENNMEAEAASLLADFKKAGDNYLRIGVNYPPHEVNYEHAIVSPAVRSLLDLYLITGEKKYLDGAKLQLPLLEAFSGYQPSYHLNDIPIRHWDGYWFGKRETWGDTMPHQGGATSALAYRLYARATGDASYQQRAENIARNNLCHFFEDGTASCAYIYPYKVNGVKAQFYDPYANEQDSALATYLMVYGY
ncbi:hypothetical protein FACS189443_4400 [Planctomycetales bacterium]|nr:hypothetical protein FACS189443_4400 [Planctomycetales bacterium]